jgi:hypothetical protein
VPKNWLRVSEVEMFWVSSFSMFSLLFSWAIVVVAPTRTSSVRREFKLTGKFFSVLRESFAFD